MRRPSRFSRRARRRLGTLLRRLVLGLFALWCLFPVYWLATMSLKTPVEAASRNPSFLFRPILDNYRAVLDRPEIWGYFVNSSIVALGSTALVLLIGVPCAYALGRYRFRGAADFGFWILTTRMTPPVAVLIPFYVLYVRTGLVDTRAGLILAHVALNLSIAVWLMKGFFEDLPPELEEAALVDGATRWQAFRDIALPVAVPGIAAVAILCFLFSWNEFLFSLVLAGSTVRTVPLGLYSFIGYQQIDWGSLSASAVLLLAPVLVILVLFGRHLVRGLTLGAVK
ncbi:carbohydrate ABC transporter permease [Rubellimicrobium sp. CFH 75288]|uniref:carbohydrate ABC transporter permease n=1 Tax=Rubellimicrobium sp. CFH 75288 TaxID=2697034 RepID=UPI001AA18DED